METTIPIADVGTIGILLSAIGGLWAWHIKTVNKKDDELKEERQAVKELAQKVVSVVESNTIVQSEQVATLRESAKATETLNRTLTDYVLKAATKR